MVTKPNFDEAIRLGRGVWSTRTMAYAFDVAAKWHTDQPLGR